MKQTERRRALNCAARAARLAGRQIRENLNLAKKVNAVSSHDIKLELDVRCQQLIERTLRQAFPEIALLGEEGETGNTQSDCRWVVDPIDGTVNFTYGIPHACVSIALQQRAERPSEADYEDGYQTIIGVVFDPFCNELWTAIHDQRARMNGKMIHASKRRDLKEAIVSIGFAKNRTNLERALPYFIWLARRVRKIRMMGAAALGLAYVASGRFDAYIERGVNLWDIAAGGLILECAGGQFWHELAANQRKYRMVASSGALTTRLPLPK